MVPTSKKLNSLKLMPFTICSSLYYSPRKNEESPHLACDSSLENKLNDCINCVFFYKHVSETQIDSLIQMLEGLEASEPRDKGKDESTYY